jgi:hypothetical protein
MTFADRDMVYDSCRLTSQLVIDDTTLVNIGISTNALMTGNGSALCAAGKTQVMAGKKSCQLLRHGHLGSDTAAALLAHKIGFYLALNEGTSLFLLQRTNLKHLICIGQSFLPHHGRQHCATRH